jgi:hypothetical protein
MRAALVAIGMCVLVATGARAHGDDAFRCGTKLVELGESRLDVRSKCGKPTLEDRRIEQRNGGDIVTVDEWSYNLGPGSFTPTFRFENGKLVHIDVGDYGYSR